MNLSHGLTNTPAHKAWQKFSDRRNKGHDVNPKWTDFMSFLSEMRQPSAGQRLYRLDKSQGWYKNNCVWATPDEYKQLRYNQFIGKKYNNWTIISLDNDYKGRGNKVICECQCGTITSQSLHQVVKGVTKSCGASSCRKKAVKHGMCGTPTYRTWSCMIQRCTNPKDPAWDYYGGRGVRVCEEWMTFQNFLDDMGVRPIGKTLDKDIIKNGNLLYCKEFCCWATPSEQQSHLRPRGTCGVK